MKKEQLEKVWYIQKEINWLVQEIESVEDKVFSFSRHFDGAKVKTSCKNSKEDYIIKMAQYKQELKKRLASLSATKKEITSAIYKVDDSLFRTILLSRHIDCNGWEQVAQDISYSVKHTKRLYEKALCELENVS